MVSETRGDDKGRCQPAPERVTLRASSVCRPPPPLNLFLCVALFLHRVLFCARASACVPYVRRDVGIAQACGTRSGPTCAAESKPRAAHNGPNGANTRGNVSFGTRCLNDCEWVGTQTLSQDLVRSLLY